MWIDQRSWAGQIRKYKKNIWLFLNINSLALIYVSIN